LRYFDDSTSSKDNSESFHNFIPTSSITGETFSTAFTTSSEEMTALDSAAKVETGIRNREIVKKHTNHLATK